MRILFITNSIGYGGAEKMMNFVTDILVKENNFVLICNLNTVSSDISQHNQSINPRIKIITLNRPTKKSHLKVIFQIVSIVKSEKIDLMIAFTMFPNFYAKIASIITGKPSIMSERGDPNITFSKDFKDRFIRFVINKSSGAVFQTEEASFFYSKRLRKRGTVIANPISTENIKFNWICAKDRPKTIVSVGRFQNCQKRMDVMLNAFKLFSKSHPEYILKLYGSGEEDYVKNICLNLSITDKVKLMGVTKNPMKEIFGEGMYVITSDYEGIPNSLLEAMAVGLPVISTDCSPGGAKLLIKNKENGLIVPKGDYIAIAEAMSEFAENPNLANQCSKKAMTVTDSFSKDKIGQLWIKYINRFSK